MRSPSYKKSQSLARGLALLQALSTFALGAASISELSRATGIHRTTVKRVGPQRS
ncbi:helix-turn-helix domain-containing protein [Paenalcaligenes sp.]|uniref:helix-turn-helix domain-containing protein n=1 Tax=Paenalcaligenes sp. TaxID=1966342 RepID=UPI00344D6F7D